MKSGMHAVRTCAYVDAVKDTVLAKALPENIYFEALLQRTGVRSFGLLLTIIVLLLRTLENFCIPS